MSTDLPEMHTRVVRENDSKRVASLTTLGAFGRRLLLAGLPLAGIALAVGTIVPLGLVGSGGTGGGDAYAYWLAGRAVVSGEDLYGGQPGDDGAFLYPPLVAQIMAPVAWLLPSDAFIWGIRLIGLACLVIATGSWTRAGLALLLFPPVIVELAGANVNLVLAAVCALLLRGHAALIVPGSLLKFAGWPLLPLAWLRDRRGLARGTALAAVAVAVSLFLSWDAWVTYATTLASVSPTSYWTNLGSSYPLPLRLLVAIGLGLLATRWIRVAPLALVAGMPIVWFNTLSILVVTITRLNVRTDARRDAPARLQRLGLAPWRARGAG